VTCPSRNTCDPISTSTCEADAKCKWENRGTPSTCVTGSNFDCSWCQYGSKTNSTCVFDSNDCKICEDYRSKDECGTVSKCSWCPSIQTCLSRSDESECPSCSVLDEDHCYLEFTDDTCQYCISQTSCLNTAEVCNATCTQATKESCGGDDCRWCAANNTCFETREVCISCKGLTPDRCSLYPGCTLCATGFCTDDPNSCPVCAFRTKDNCFEEEGVPLNCDFCNSSQSCIAKGDVCAACSSITGDDATAVATQCNVLPGCTYCKSDRECKEAEGDLSTCECSGLPATVCSWHNKGCCWSANDGGCFDIDDNKCGGGLNTTTIIIIAVCVGVVVIALAILIPVLVCCCKPKTSEGIEMNAPGTIVVLPEGQPSMVVQESIQSLDPATAVSVDETATNAVVTPAAAPSVQDMQMQNMLQQQMLNNMMAQSMAQSMMMNPMMMNSMGMMNMSGMGNMNSMGMDMSSMGMTGGMNSMNMSGGMNSMGNMGNMGMTQPNGVAPTAEGTV